MTTVRQQYAALIEQALARHRLGTKRQRCSCGVARGESQQPLTDWHRNHVADQVAAAVLDQNQRIITAVKGATP